MSFEPQRSYADLLDNDTLLTVMGAFQELHPDLLPIVVYRVLKDAWFGELTSDEIKQALRDAYDMAERGLVPREGSSGLQSPSAFVAARLRLCLENQALLVQLGCRDSSPAKESPLPTPLQEDPAPARLLQMLQSPPQSLAG